MSRAATGWRRMVWIAVGALLSVAGLVIVVQGVDVARTAEVLRSVNPAPLAVAALAIAAQLWIRATRWSMLLPRNGRRIPPARVLPALLIGYLGNAVLPARLGEVLRAGVISRREAIDPLGAVGSIVLERGIDLVALVVVSLPALWLAGAPAWLVQAALLAAGVASLVLVAAQTPVVRWFMARTNPSGPAARTLPWLIRCERILSAVRLGGRGRTALSAFDLSIGTWLLDGTIYWLIAMSLGISLSFAGAIVISSITVLGTALPSAPGYLGVFELVAATVAQLLGVAPDQALAFAILAHAFTLIPLALGGAISAAWIGVRRTRITSLEPAAAR
jgi:uncharacterized membrane protein YbhN (UPF0104 family)